jgi:L-iditol 2-dehydrogenase
MQAIMFHGPGDARLAEVPTPTPGTGEILVRVEAALTCGTDAKAYRRGHPVLFRTIPSPFGHEFAGTVAAVGSQVIAFQPGQRVVAANSAPCGHCDECRRRRESLCESLEFLNGAYAEYLIVPARIVRRNTYLIPDHVAFAEAALAEPMACVLHGLDALDLALGDTVAVIGAGAIGLLFVDLLTRRGQRVIALDHHPGHLRAARHFGASETVLVSDNLDALHQARELTERNRGVEAVVEAAGYPDTWEMALGMVRKGGQVLLFGGPPAGAKVSLDTRQAHYEELSLKGVFHHTPVHVQRAVQLITSGQLRARDYLTANRPLSETIAALEDRASGIKTVILPPGAKPARLGALAGVL